jgi:hypothetical protein
MTQSTPGSPNPFAATPSPETKSGTHQPARSRHMSLPLRMDDGEVKLFDLPAALANPQQFSAGELERLTRAYAEALGLLKAEL